MRSKILALSKNEDFKSLLTKRKVANKYVTIFFGNLVNKDSKKFNISFVVKKKIGNEVKRRILIGTYALSAGYYDAYYLKAQKCRQLVANDFKEVFKNIDVLLSPTTPGTSFKAGEKTNDPIAMYLQDIFTIPANLAGLPGLSIPCGENAGLPLGLQLVGNSLEEDKLLQFAHSYQLNTDWHSKMPDIS